MEATKEVTQLEKYEEYVKELVAIEPKRSCKKCYGGGIMGSDPLNNGKKIQCACMRKKVEKLHKKYGYNALNPPPSPKTSPDINEPNLTPAKGNW
jgi:hypothetical protein